MGWSCWERGKQERRPGSFSFPHGDPSVRPWVGSACVRVATATGPLSLGPRDGRRGCCSRLRPAWKGTLPVPRVRARRSHVAHSHDDLGGPAPAASPGSHRRRRRGGGGCGDNGHVERPSGRRVLLVPVAQDMGSHRALCYAYVNRADNATARRSPGKLAVVEEKAALSHLCAVEAGRSDAADADADHVAAAADEATSALPPWKLRTRRRPKPKVATPSTSMSPPPPPHERRPLRACTKPWTGRGSP